MLVGHDVAVIGQVVKIAESVTVFPAVVIDGDERGEHVHLFKRIVGALAVAVFETDVCIDIEDVFAQVEFQAGVVCPVVIAQKNTFFIGVVVGEGVLRFLRTTTKAEHIVL